MEGEGSRSNPFQENYYFYNNGSSPRSLNLIQLMEAPDPQQDLLGQPDLSQELGRNISYVDLLTREQSPSPLIHQGSTAQRFEGSMNSGWNQFSGGPSTFQRASSSGALLGSISFNLPSTYSPSNNAGRNVRFRRTNDLQDYRPVWPLNGVNMQQHSQLALHFPCDPFLNYASSSTVPMQLNEANMFASFYQEMNLMNRASYVINPPDFMTPVFEWGYLENEQRNMNMAFPGAGSMAHATRIIAEGHQAPSSSTFPQTNWANSRIMENLIVNGSESQGHYHPMHSFHAATIQMGGVSNIRHRHASSSQAGQRVVRRGVANQMGAVFNIGRGHASSSQAGQRVTRQRARRPSPRIRLPTTTERRRRFINEELIALEEQLGTIANEVEQIQVVENGLTEDTIMARLIRGTYHPPAAGKEEYRACSICQDEYGEGDLLWKLDCGHGYHFECIKQWLMRKNSCPMCRRRALAI